MSVVIPSHNEGEELKRTVHHHLATLPPDGEVIVVDDASTDGSANFLDQDEYSSVRLLRPGTRLGASNARNMGASHASGEVLVFSDAHVEPDAGWTEAICATVGDSAVGGAAPVVRTTGDPSARGFGLTWTDTALNVRWLEQEGTAPYPVPMLPGCFLAMRRKVFAACGGFDPGLELWGSEDVELCVRLWTLGYECMVVPNAEIAHRFQERFDYQLDWGSVMHNLVRLAVLHLSAARLEQALSSLANSSGFPAALARVVESEVWTRRDEIRANRRFDDRWFLERFQIDVFD